MSRRLTEHERQLWTRVARTVRPVHGRHPIIDAEETQPAPSTPSQASLKGLSTPSKQTLKRPSPSTPADVSNQRRLRRGQAEIDARLDLHGLTQDDAFSNLARFLVSQQALGARCVLVITGKGKLGTGILRSRLIDWLSAPDLRPLISGYSKSHTRHGGDGAFYVLLKARKTER